MVNSLPFVFIISIESKSFLIDGVSFWAFLTEVSALMPEFEITENSTLFAPAAPAKNIVKMNTKNSFFIG